MTATEEFRRQAVGLLSALVREVGFIVAEPNASRRAPKLRSGALYAAKGLSDGSMAPGEAAQEIVEAVRAHVASKRASGAMSHADARLGRALACYMDEELKLAARIFPEGLPPSAAWDVDAFRARLATELVMDGYISHSEDGTEGFEWTFAGMEAAEAPSPPDADDEGFLLKDSLFPR